MAYAKLSDAKTRYEPPRTSTPSQINLREGYIFRIVPKGKSLDDYDGEQYLVYRRTNGQLVMVTKQTRDERIEHEKDEAQERGFFEKIWHSIILSMQWLLAYSPYESKDTPKTIWQNILWYGGTITAAIFTTTCGATIIGSFHHTALLVGASMSTLFYVSISVAAFFGLGAAYVAYKTSDTYKPLKSLIAFGLTTALFTYAIFQFAVFTGAMFPIYTAYAAASITIAINWRICRIAVRKAYQAVFGFDGEILKYSESLKFRPSNSPVHENEYTLTDENDRQLWEEKTVTSKIALAFFGVLSVIVGVVFGGLAFEEVAIALQVVFAKGTFLSTFIMPLLTLFGIVPTASILGGLAILGAISTGIVMAVLPLMGAYELMQLDIGKAIINFFDNNFLISEAAIQAHDEQNAKLRLEDIPEKSIVKARLQGTVKTLLSSGLLSLAAYGLFCTVLAGMAGLISVGLSVGVAGAITGIAFIGDGAFVAITTLSFINGVIDWLFTPDYKPVLDAPSAAQTAAFQGGRIGNAFSNAVIALSGFKSAMETIFSEAIAAHFKAPANRAAAFVGGGQNSYTAGGYGGSPVLQSEPTSDAFRKDFKTVMGTRNPVKGSNPYQYTYPIPDGVRILQEESNITYQDGVPLQYATVAGDLMYGKAYDLGGKSSGKFDFYPVEGAANPFTTSVAI